MAKQESNEAKRLAGRLKELSTAYEVEDPPARDPVMQLVSGFLQWEATQEQAEEALGRIMESVVDVNDLRVSLDEEILAMLGPGYPLAEQRVARLREALYEVYRREHAVEMQTVAKASKKEQRAYLDTLPGITPYVAARVMLLSFGGHAMPVDRKLVALLAGDEIVKPGSPPGQVESWLLRQVKADEALRTHLLFQAWADDSEVPEEALTGAVAVAASKGKAGASKSRTKKKTTKKKTTKKSTTRRAKKK